jgi:hypothetical protein
MAWYSPLPSNSDPPNFPNLVDLGCRAAHSCDKVGNSLYIFGGWNGKKALNDLYVLDLDKLTCPPVDNSSSMPQPNEMSYANN